MAYLIHIAILVCIYGIVAMSLNLIVGYTGLISITHAAFFGMGAYATAILMVGHGVNFFVAMLVGIAVAAVASLLIGRVLAGLTSDYYVLGTIGFNYIVFGILINWAELTRGPLGIPGIPRPNIFGIHFSTDALFLFLAFVFLVATYAVCRWVAASSFGRILKAIREDEGAIQVFGYRTSNYKLAVFVIGGALAAVAGSFYASFIRFVAPSSFSVLESAFIFSIVVLGGAANLKGSLIGAFFLVLLPEALRFVGFSADIAAQMRQVVYGLLLVVLMLYRPQGLMGEYKL